MKRTTTLKKETRRSIFAWATIILCILSIVVYAYYSLNFLGSAIVVDSILEIARNSYSGMTVTMQEDLTHYRNVQNFYLIRTIMFIPLYALAILSVFMWKGHDEKYFFKSLFFRK